MHPGWKLAWHLRLGLQLPNSSFKQQGVQQLAGRQ
jgi:hypothetical protein